MKATSVYSPQSKGLCELHNNAIADTSLKVQDDYGYDLETALSRALCAKNSLMKNKFFKNIQVQFGCNPNLSNDIDNSLGARNGFTQPIFYKKFDHFSL